MEMTLQPGAAAALLAAWVPNLIPASCWAILRARAAPKSTAHEEHDSRDQELQPPPPALTEPNPTAVAGWVWMQACPGAAAQDLGPDSFQVGFPNRNTTLW